MKRFRKIFFVKKYLDMSKQVLYYYVRITCIDKNRRHIMGKYTEDSKELLRLVGGKENIAADSRHSSMVR